MWQAQPIEWHHSSVHSLTRICIQYMHAGGHGGMGAFLSLERMPVGGRVCRDY